VILVDPYPRTLDQIFSLESRARLEALFAGRAPTRLQRADPATVEKLRSRPIGR